MKTPVSMCWQAANAAPLQPVRMDDLMARFQAIGETRGAFCRARAMALSTFDRWRRLLQADTPTVST